MSELTEAEKNIIHTIISNKIFNRYELAKILNVKITTISSHLSHIYTKCELKENCMAGLVDYYYTNKKEF